MEKNWNILIILGLIYQIGCIVNVAPSWKTSNYIQAASHKVINYVMTGSGTTPKATIPFPNGSFSAIPNLGYGVSGYEGNNAFTQRRIH